MKFLIIPFCLAVLLSCGQHEQKTSVIKTPMAKNAKYRNSSGVEITLNRQNDTTMRTLFKDGSGRVFDTVMQIKYNCGMSDLISGHKKDTFPFLIYNHGWGGIQMGKDSLIVCEFSNIGALGFDTRMDVYEKTFFRVRE